MTKTTTNPRRRFIQRFVYNAGLLLNVALLAPGCGTRQEKSKTKPGEDRAVTACDDLSNVSKEDLAVRSKLGYVEESPLPDNHCGNCNLYLPPAEGQACGGCMLFKGPVFADAYCTYWAPKI